MKFHIRYYGFLIALILPFISCEKEFLEKKTSTSLIVPTSLDDFQRLMDDYLNINAVPILGEFSSDDWYMASDGVWDAENAMFRNAYIWNAEIYDDTQNVLDWSRPYHQVLVANVVLDGLEQLPVNATNQADWNRIKGWALFVRAHAFYNLAQLFAPVYDANTAATDMGIPIRLRPGVDEISERATVQETYDRIISDLNEAVPLLPENLQTPNRNRPCRPAVLGLLARTYLNMRNYEMALEYADLSLQLHDQLMDYNDLGTARFTRDNIESLYNSPLGMGYRHFTTAYPNTRIDTTLFNSYGETDLRKRVFFNANLNTYRNSYGGQTYAFGGIATDEIYLIKAECLIRQNRQEEGMDVLNQLWLKRSDNTREFIPLTAETTDEALAVTLTERRKELIFRGLRWQDLRRLNKEGHNIELKRILKGQEFILPPNSPLYILPIPNEEIRLSGIPQNIRE